MKPNNQSVTCKHESGVMIPEQDIDGNYIKPRFMLCTDCRLVFKWITNRRESNALS